MDGTTVHFADTDRFNDGVDYLGKGDLIMSILFWISGVVAVALLIYLFIALLRPEKFQ
jgi:K+-transporting ATPase KdpF subunit